MDRDEERRALFVVGACVTDTDVAQMFVLLLLLMMKRFIRLMFNQSIFLWLVSYSRKTSVKVTGPVMIPTMRESISEMIMPLRDS